MSKGGSGAGATLKRKLVDVVHLHDREEHEAVRERLEDLIGAPVERKFHPPVPRATQPTTEVLSNGVEQPKPEGRIVDEQLLEIFRDYFLRCALADTPAGRECWYHPQSGGRASFHHIKRRGQGGDDIVSNGLPLCDGHHTGQCGWHAPHWNPTRWCMRYFGFLAEQWQLNIARWFPRGVPVTHEALIVAVTIEGEQRLALPPPETAAAESSEEGGA